MIIQSTDTSHPVLLFLHGGPGLPEFFLNTTHPTSLERDYTVVWWERGSGLSYGPDIPPQSMTVAQLVADTIAVTHYLRQRFGKDKITLFGHSWGSFLGIQVAAKAPDLYHAYVGMGQVSCLLRSEVKAIAICWRSTGRGEIRRWCANLKRPLSTWRMVCRPNGCACETALCTA